MNFPLLGVKELFLNCSVLNSPVSAAAPVSRSPVIIRQVMTNERLSFRQSEVCKSFLLQAHSSVNKNKRDTSGNKAIHNCDSCAKSFTTKFNLKRHINMHCHKSRENGVPIQVTYRSVSLR